MHACMQPMNHTWQLRCCSFLYNSQYTKHHTTSHMLLLTHSAPVPCRTRFYRAELRGTAAWEHDLEQGLHQSQASLAAPSPGLGSANALASGLSKAEVWGMSKAWGSANIVLASDGTPIMPSSTSVRPKAKVSCTCDSCAWTKRLLQPKFSCNMHNYSMPSSTTVRPKAKVSCTRYLVSWIEWQRQGQSTCSELA